MDVVPSFDVDPRLTYSDACLAVRVRTTKHDFLGVAFNLKLSRIVSCAPCIRGTGARARA